MNKIKRNYYSKQKIVCINHQLQYVENENGYLYANGVYPTRIKTENLPEWFVSGRYFGCQGYISTKGIVDLKYVPNLWINHFLKDDFMLVSYNEQIRQVSESKHSLEKYDGYDTVIYGTAILHFLKAVQKYSDIDISKIASQIQEKADMMPKKHPEEFEHFKFDVEAHLNKD